MHWALAAGRAPPSGLGHSEAGGVTGTSKTEKQAPGTPALFCGGTQPG